MSYSRTLMNMRTTAFAHSTIHTLTSARPRDVQQPRPSTAFRSWYNFIILSVLLGLTKATEISSRVASCDNTASVLRIASSVAAWHSQQAIVPAIPIPSSLPNHEELRQLAALMPPLQAFPTPSTNRERCTDRKSVESSSTITSPRLSPEDDRLSDLGHLEGRATPLRILIVGDSMTQGAEGDYTWRYRIWSWLRQQNVSATFVGPYTGTQQPDELAVATNAAP